MLALKKNTSALWPAIWRNIIIALLPGIIWLTINFQYTFHNETVGDLEYTVRADRFADKACIYNSIASFSKNLEHLLCR